MQSRTIKIVVPDSGPLNTLAAADLLDLLLKPRNVQLVLVDAVVREVISQSEPLASFIARNKDRIEIARTPTEQNIQEVIRLGGQPSLRGAGEAAIADFMVNGIDDVAASCPALVIFEERKMPRFRQNTLYSERVHLITTAAYLLKLESAGIIDSFKSVWQRVVDANQNLDPTLHRSPSTLIHEIPADGGSEIEFGF